MKKLKNKIFCVIFSILTIFLMSILAIFNFQNYQQEVNAIRGNLMRMEDNKNREPNRPPNSIFAEDKTQPEIFMDSTIYVAILDQNYNIVDVINHTTKDVDDEEIIKIAEQIIKNDNKKGISIGNLYLEDYSYLFTKSANSLVIMDNSSTKENLIEALKTSILIFGVLEIIIILVSRKLTSWIIRPVIETFNKQKQFIADASHELKTPLSVIIASSEALENEPEEKKWLANIKSESERMNTLITELLEMAKSENVAKEQYTNENLSKVVEKIILTFESLAYEKDLSFDYELEKDIYFLCNQNQIKQLVSILIDNGVKHSSPKEKIKISLKKEKNNIILTVTNKGNTIPKEEQEKIFERFYRADESRNRNENRYGLGLAIAKNIVTNHNGTISVKSENGYTTFKVVLR